MSALGQFGSPIAQGYGQGRQYKDEQRRLYNQQALQERQVATGEEALAEQKRVADRDFSAREIHRLEDITLSPDFNVKYSAGARQKIQMQLDGLYARYPELKAPMPGEGIGPVAAAPAAQPLPPDTRTNPITPQARAGMAMTDAAMGAVNTGLANAPMSQPPPPPLGPNDITDQQVSSLMRETDPNFNIAQNERQAAMQTSAQPMAQPQSAAPQQPAAGPAKPEPTLTDRTRAGIKRLLQMSEDDLYSPEQQQHFLEQATAMMGQLKAQAASDAQTRFTNVQANEFGPTAESGRAVNTENIAASQYKRGTYDPAMLSLKEKELALEKLKAQQKAGGMSTSDWIQMLRLQHDLSKDAASAQFENRKFEYGVGRDAAEFAYKTGEGERTAETDARRGMLKVLQQAQMTVDPITHVPVMKPGGLEAYRRGVQELVGKGLNPTPADINPGFHPKVWEQVNTPGFDVNAAMQAAQAAGDQGAVNQYKAAASFVRQMTSGQAASPSRKPSPAAKPKKPAPKPSPKASPSGGGAHSFKYSSMNRAQ